MRSLWTSPLRASPISLPPTLAIAWRARQLNSSLWSVRSFLILFTTRCNNSKKSHSKISDLLFGVFIRGDEVNSFEVSKIDVPTQDINVQELRSYQQPLQARLEVPNYLADIFLLVVSIEISICHISVSILAQGPTFHRVVQTFELLPV